MIEAVKRVLRPSGQLVLEIDDGEWLKSHFERNEWRFVDKDHLICRERSLSGEGDRLICRDVLVHTEKGIVADRFYSLTLFTPDRVHALLERAGFINLRERLGDEHTLLFLAEAAARQDRRSAAVTSDLAQRDGASSAIRVSPTRPRSATATRRRISTRVERMKTALGHAHRLSVHLHRRPSRRCSPG